MPRTIDAPTPLTLTAIVTLSDEGLRALLAELEDDPAAQRRLRAGYAGTEDPLAMLRWRLDPGAADHPLREVPRLERIVHARAGTADERRRQGDSTRRLRELTERYRTDQGDLDDAIRRYLEPDVKPDRPRRPWYRHPALWTAVAAAAVLGALGYDRALRSVDSLTVFERPQTPQELDFAQGPVPFGADPARSARCSTTTTGSSGSRRWTGRGRRSRGTTAASASMSCA